MNPKLYQKLLTRVQVLQDMHYQCAEKYSTYNMRLFIPSVTITTLASIASFLTASEYLSPDVQGGFSIAVGVLSVISSMMQSFSNTLKYPAKIEGHQLAADEYSKLLTRLQFEYLDPNEENFFDDIEEQILKIKNNCKYYPLRSVVNNLKHKLSLENFTDNTEHSDKISLI